MVEYPLTKIDEILLYELGINARIPINKIAGKYSISKDTLKRHMEKLEKEKIIKGYITRLNMTSLGYVFLTFLARSSGLNPKLSDFLVRSFGSIKQCGWIGILGGTWDIYGGFWVKDFKEALEIKDKIVEKTGKYLLNTEYCLNLHRNYYNNMGFLKHPEKFKKVKSIAEYSGKTPVKLDEDDIAILQMIENNARISYVEISESTGIPPSKVQFRLKQMIKKKLILNFRTLFDDKRIGVDFSAVTLRFKNYNEKILKKLTELCDSDPNIGYMGRMVGPFDAWVEFHVPKEKTWTAADEIKRNLGEDLLSLEQIHYYDIKRVRYYPAEIPPLKNKNIKVEK